MAVEDINKAGGVGGRQVSLVVEDSAGDPSKGVTAFQKLLAADHAQAVFSIVSGVDLALIPIAEREPIVLISHATHPQITNGRKHVLRHANTVQEEASLIVSSLDPGEANGGVSILHLNDDYGVAIAAELRSGISARFPNSHVNEIAFGNTETTFTAQVTEALRSNPKVVIVASLGKTAGIAVRRLRELAYGGKIIATLGFIVTDAPAAAGQAAEGVWCVDFQPPPAEQTAELRARYQAKTGESNLPMGVILFYNSAKLWAHLKAMPGSEEAGQLVANAKTLGTFVGTGETITISSNGDMLPSLRLIQYSRNH